MTNAPNRICPVCGNTAEIMIRNRGIRMGSAQIRCPYNHYHYGTAFHAGSEKATRELLLAKWDEMVNAGGDKGSL